MAPTHLHIEGDASTFVGVVAGAFLATIGGILASQFEHHVGSRRKARHTAMLFGEVVAAIRLIVGLADDSRGRGDPYGRLTMQLLKAALRETEIAERNREALFDLRAAAVRVRIHVLLVRINLVLESIIELTHRIAALEAQDEDRRAVLARDRDSAFAYLLDLRDECGPLIEDLETIAGESLRGHEGVAAGVGIATLRAPAAA